MKKILYKILIVTVFTASLLLVNKTIVNAATAGISASSTDVKVGDNVNVNVSINAVTWNVKVNGSGITDTIVGGNLDELANKSTNKTYKLDTSKPGTYTISLSGDVTDASNGNTTNQAGTVTIRVSEKNNTNSSTSQSNNNANNSTNNKTNNNTNNNTNTTSRAATSNTTKSDTAQEPTFTASNKTEYATGDINVRSSYSSSSSAVGSLKKGDSVTVVGVGSNGWSKVTYNGKTAYIKSDLLTATKPQEEKDKEKNEEKSTNKALKSLDIESISLAPEFNKDTTSYTVTVGKDVEKLNINAVPENENAKVTITGNENLQIGENTVKISVTAEDGTVRTYTIIVKKQNEDTLGLASLKINGVSLKESFKTNVYEYSVNLKGNEDLSKLDIIAKANKEDATIEIIGNENLTIGENVITIMVKSKDGKENVTYQILVNKPEKTNDVVSSEDEYTNNNSKIFLYVAIGIFAVALLLIILIIVRSIKKSKEDDEEDHDAYGFKYNENNNIAEELYTIKNNDEFAEEETQMESTKTKLYDVEKEVDFSDDEERRPRRKGKHSK